MAPRKMVMVQKLQFLLLVALIAMANARIEFFTLQNPEAKPHVSPLVLKQEECAWPECCQNCECGKDETGKKQCECLDFKYNGVPPSCVNGICLLMFPAYCRCTDKIERCPRKCL